LSLGYLAAAARFVACESRETARGLLYSSLVYLPALLAVLTWDHLRLLS
jgi:protoheme IX farnesyltransferase